ncbi:MAG: trypsin-like peptidase domain-containing protein [Planctomycetota bacterium]
MKDPFAAGGLPRLKPIDVPGLVRPISLGRRDDGGARLTVGRSPDNDLALEGDAFPSVSGHHARLDLEEGVLRVVDLGSRNGTLVNGKPIDGPTALEIGDQVRLGSVGPKFLVVGSRSMEETVFVRQQDVSADAGEVETIVARGNRVTVVRVSVLVAILIGAVGWFVWDSTQTRERLESEIASRDEEYGAQLQQAYEQIAALDARERERASQELSEEVERAERVAALESTLNLRAEELQQAVDTRVARETQLRARIDELEQDGASREVLERVERDLRVARDDLDKTRSELVSAQRQVELFDPVNLAQARLSGVAEVRSSVVLIENQLRIRKRDTGATLFLDGYGPSAVPNFDGIGEEFVLESTGSGFCVDAEGWIVTNAHVVGPPDSDLLRAIGSAPMLEQVIQLEVVFSGESTRYPAEVVRVADGGVDLALVKIEPFESMPRLRSFDPAIRSPLPGSDIYLFGFPLGHLAVQEGETVIASTFRGILSRNVGGQMQVDAGVHPGNSGGPITDARGRVIGVVVSVQALPDRTAVYTIGYGIPIAEAARIWPPPVEATKPAEPGEATDAGVSASTPTKAVDPAPGETDPPVDDGKGGDSGGG